MSALPHLAPMSMADVSDDLVGVILQARDLCGNEREAARAWCAEEGVVYSQALLSSAMAAADKEWHRSQIAAGARILSGEERAAACRAVEGGN